MNNAPTKPPKSEVLFREYDDVVTVPELAKMLRIGRNNAYDLIKHRYIQSVKVGKQIRVPKSSVIDFVECR